MKLRKVSLLLTSGLLAISLAACSAPFGESPSPKESSEASATTEETEQPKQTETEAQEEIRQKWSLYMNARLEGPTDFDAMFLPYGDNEMTAAEIVEQEEGNEDSIMDMFYFDEDFTTNEKAVVLISDKSNSQFANFARFLADEDAKFEADLNPEKILIRGDKAFVKTGALVISVNGEETPMSDAPEDINSIWVRKDGEWLLDARAQLDILLLAFWTQTGGEEATPENVLELLRVVPS